MFLQWFEIPEEKIRLWSGTTGTDVYYPRILLEQLIPELAKWLGISTEQGYGLIYLALLEYGADMIGLNRLKVYEFHTFEALVLNKFCALEGPNIEGLRNDKVKGSVRMSKHRKRWLLYEWLYAFRLMYTEK